MSTALPAAEQEVIEVPPQQQTAREKLIAFFVLLKLVTAGAWKHYSIGPPAPTWPLFVSIATYLIRTQATWTAQTRRAHPPKTRGELIGLAQVKTLLEKIAVANDALEDAIVVEVEIPVRKRELGGLLEELSARETGDRKLKAEWSIHNSLLKSTAAPGEQHRDPRDKVLLYLHGGAHIRLSPRTHRRAVAQMSKEFRCRALSLDYRLSPGVVFPASTLDSVSTYFYLTEDLGIPAEDIIVAGDSAGGNLALTLIQYLRDAGLPQVGAAYVLSPWCDLTTSFESWHQNGEHDYIKIDDENDPMHPPRLYLSTVYPRTPAGDAAYERLKASPYVSQAVAPLSALKNLPPILVHTGGLETLLDENIVLVRRLRKAEPEKNNVTHQIWSDGVHVFQALQADRAGASAFAEAGKWYARLISAHAGGTASTGSRGKWANELDESFEMEKKARIARAGPIKHVKPADSRWKYVRSVERPQDALCKPEAHEAAKKAAEEANSVSGELAESEVFRPYSTLRMEVYSVTDIPDSSELSIEYLPGLITSSAAERRQQLRTHFGFDTCLCSVCSASPEDVARSDARRREIKAISQSFRYGGGGDRKAKLAGLQRIQDLLVEEGYKGLPDFGDSDLNRAFTIFRTMSNRKPTDTLT
ncbi:hypothetical protein JCM10908_002200 [Rhodotorula pacifica]|uniref:uncharacterized protein n=1 Tax=Rhodotorula pacifica TaxID=1495444 RepID=UPI00316CE90B